MPCSTIFSINLQTEILSTKTSDFLKQMIFSSHLILCCLCNGLKQKNVIVPDEIHERTSTGKILNFWTDCLDKQCKLKSACSLGMRLIRVYTVDIPFAHC